MLTRRIFPTTHLVMSKSIMTDAELLAWIDAFVTQHSLPPTTFGRLTLGDANLISYLRAGRSLSLKRAKRICDFMTEYNPTTQSETKPRAEDEKREAPPRDRKPKEKP